MPKEWPTKGEMVRHGQVNGVITAVNEGGRLTAEFTEVSGGVFTSRQNTFTWRVNGDYHPVGFTFMHSKPLVWL